ncbi:MAG TPA: hypothetical protein VER12_04645 [Polyangiaceae bacterium]|nr:hypothetical protein [Polyangiaceae bacterium]
MPNGQDQAKDQTLANLSALPHFGSFTEHRRRLTALTLAAAAGPSERTLCVLGAGNCFDLDLVALAERYSSVHLVDIDAQALERTFARQDRTTQDRLVLHAALDLSGLLDKIDRWSRFQVTPEELMAHAPATAARLNEQLGGPFDVVLSACMLSQMQLSVLNVLSDQHRLFEAVRWTLNLSHFRTLAALTRPSGSALFATDLSSEQLHAALAARADTDCTALVHELSSAGKVFDFADPKRLAALFADDPLLRAAFEPFTVKDAWLWSNGPETKFLVYASELRRL